MGVCFIQLSCEEIWKQQLCVMYCFVFLCYFMTVNVAV